MTFKVEGGERGEGDDIELKHCIHPDTKCSDLLFEARPFSLSFYLVLFFPKKNPISEEKSRFVLKSYQKNPPSFFLAETNHQM